MKNKLNKALSALIAAQFLLGTYGSTAMAANNFIISGDNETQTTIAGNKAYGQDYFVKKDADGNFVPDTEWKHDGAIIMTKALDDGGGDQFTTIFKKINDGRILPTYTNISKEKDHWAPTFIAIMANSYRPGADGYEQIANELRDAINASAGNTLEEKMKNFVKNKNIPERWKDMKKMIMIQIEKSDSSEDCYSRLCEGATKIEPNYGTVQIGRLGVWRPMDWGDTVYYKDESCTSEKNKLASIALLRIMPNGNVMWIGNRFNPQESQADRVKAVEDALLYVDKVEMQSGAKVDLSYLNTVGDNPRVNQYADDKVYYDKQNRQSPDSLLARTMVINNAVLDKDTTFRIGSYKIILRQDKTNEFIDCGGRRGDTVWIKNATQKNASDTPSKINIELGYVPELGEKISGGFTMAKNGTSGSYNTVFGIMNGANNFEVVGKATRAEGIFSEYLIEPEIQEFLTNDKGYFKSDDGSYYAGRAWCLLGYKYEIVGASEGGKTAGDNIVAINNLWKNSQRNVFRRAGGLHNVGQLTDPKDNTWAEAWHGNYQSAATYGRKISQSFNGYQVGYDTLISPQFYNGKVYLGTFINKNDGKSTTQTGRGDQDALGLGLYGTWVGNRGHYIDVAVSRSKLKNDYNFMQNFSDGAQKVTGAFDTWATGLSAQYGYRKHTKNGWFIEPQLAVYAGQVEDCRYDLVGENGKKQSLDQDGFGAITAKAGLYIGKNIGDKGNLYMGAFVGHDYAKDMGISTKYQTTQMGSTGLPITLDLSDSVNLPDSEDTWYELNVGGKYTISPTGSIYLDYSRTCKSDIGNDWKINGGLQWAF